MFLVFGGTTEGKIVAGILEKKKYPYFYSTKTEIDFRPEHYGIYRFGVFTKSSLIDFCVVNKIEIIIHASHPFAEELHQTIHQVALELTIPVLRYERLFLKRKEHELVTYLQSYPMAINYLNKQKLNNLLALTGVQTIERLKPYWKKNNTIFRILPRENSLKIAEQAAFPKENILQEMPSNNLKHELLIIKKYNIQCILTKESGESGFLSTKIEAAIQSNIPIFIFERPTLPKSFIIVHNEEELIIEVNNIKIGSLREREKESLK